MNIAALLDLSVILLLGVFVCLCPSIARRRERVRWAKNLLGLAIGLGILWSAVGLARDLNWFILDGRADVLLERYSAMVGGLLIGIVLSLAFAGQLLGTKIRPTNQLQATAARPSS